MTSAPRGGPMARKPAVWRLGVSAGAGTAAAVAAALAGAPWTLVVLAGWNTTALVFLALVWVIVLRFTPEDTRTHAMAEDESRTASRVLLLVASTASLVGVVFGLHAANRATGARHGWLFAAVIGGVICSWAVVHTVYMLRYADLYYSDSGVPIVFANTAEPDYLDFAYLAFTLGMTFQVSDNTLNTRGIRRTALMHCLLSYLFGTVIIATSINVMAGLVG